MEYASLIYVIFSKGVWIKSSEIHCCILRFTFFLLFLSWDICLDRKNKTFALVFFCNNIHFTVEQNYETVVTLLDTIQGVCAEVS